MKMLRRSTCLTSLFTIFAITHASRRVPRQSTTEPKEYIAFNPDQVQTTIIKCPAGPTRNSILVYSYLKLKDQTINRTWPKDQSQTECESFIQTITSVGEFKYTTEAMYRDSDVITRDFEKLVYMPRTSENIIFEDETFPAVDDNLLGQSAQSVCILQRSNKPKSIEISQKDGKDLEMIVDKEVSMVEGSQDSVNKLADWQVQYKFANTKNKTGDKYKLQCKISLNDKAGSVIKVQKSVNITAYEAAGKPTIISFNTNATNSEPRHGEQFSITCKAKSIPAGTVAIYNEKPRQGLKPLVISTDKRSSIQEVVWSPANGADITKHHRTFYCVAENTELGTTVKQSVQEKLELKIMKTEFEKLGKADVYVNDHMKCEVMAYPKPKKMYFNFKPSLPEDTKQKISAKITYDENKGQASITHIPLTPGTYECIVENTETGEPTVVRVAIAKKRSKIGEILKKPLYYIIAGGVVAISLVLLVLLRRRGGSDAPQSSEAGTVAETEVAASSGHDLEANGNAGDKTEEEQPLKPND